MNQEVEALLAEQIAYYRAHAPDYDDEYLGQPWDRRLDELPITGDVLELACGTGHWTPLLAVRARSVTAVDVAPEALALARQRVRGLPVQFIQAVRRVRFALRLLATRRCAAARPATISQKMQSLIGAQARP
jgi:SAM-dependent methyltransferase